MRISQIIKEKIRSAARNFAPILWRGWHRGITSRWQNNSPFGHAPRHVLSDIIGHFRDNTSEGRVLMEMAPHAKENPLPECQTAQLADAYSQLPAFDGIRVCVYQLQHARVFGGYAGMVVDRAGLIFQESTPYPWGTLCHPALRRIRWPSAPASLSGKSAYLATPEATNNYYHFMVDCLPKLALLDRAKEPLDTFDQFIINSSARFTNEVLQESGIPESKVIQLQSDTNLVVENLIVPEFQGSHDGVEDWQVEGVRRILARWISNKVATKKIYAARGNARVRRVLNEEEVVRELALKGFEIVDPSNLTVQEQAEIFSQATLVVAPHGAALTNLLFCPPGAAVVEMVHPQVINGFYRNISRAAGLRHHVFAGQGDHASNLARHRANGADLSIDIPELLKFLHESKL
ncbi:MAG: glycosyltransferase family 61 protein [Verrucomicrobiaceae bacterium]|jgi:capsular polysaccharide biosynthesis protein|nr:glycosyltransferase family 61 protein [Verrucomicrobiaceae bacterium]